MSHETLSTCMLGHDTKIEVENLLKLKNIERNAFYTVKLNLVALSSAWSQKPGLRLTLGAYDASFEFADYAYSKRIVWHKR